MNIVIDKRIYKSVEEYCKTNDLDISEYLNELIEKAHVSHVYGELPPIAKKHKEPAVFPQNAVWENDKNDVDLEKEPEIPSETVVEPTMNTGGIQVVEIIKKPKIRVLN